MTITQRAGQEPAMVRTYEYNDASVIVADLPESTVEPTVDVADGTAIVVLDDRQYEIDLPDDESVAHKIGRAHV